MSAVYSGNRASVSAQCGISLVHPCFFFCDACVRQLSRSHLHGRRHPPLTLVIVAPFSSACTGRQLIETTDVRRVCMKGVMNSCLQDRPRRAEVARWEAHLDQMLNPRLLQERHEARVSEARFFSA